MSTTPVPRLVGATWYAVPCPEGVPLTLGFPTQEACQAVCDVASTYEEALAELRESYDDKMANAVEEAADIAYGDGEAIGENAGYDQAREGCNAGTCPGYAIGWGDGFAGDAPRSAESA